MEARLENRPRQTEKALVAERVARQTDEVAQQTVETWPAGVDAEAFGRLPMFRGDIDLSGRTDSMSLWSATVWSYFGKFNQMATRLLQKVETSVEDPIIADDAAMTRPERRLSTNVLCACSDLQEEGAAAGPTSSLWETAVQRIRATSSGEIRRNAPTLLSPTKSDEPVRTVRQRGNGLKVCWSLWSLTVWSVRLVPHQGETFGPCSRVRALFCHLLRSRDQVLGCPSGTARICV